MLHIISFIICAIPVTGIVWDSVLTTAFQFHPHPTSAKLALSQGYIQISSCEDQNSVGNVYYKNDPLHNHLALIFNSLGQFAGLISLVPIEVANLTDVFSYQYDSDFGILHGMLILTRPPDSICDGPHTNHPIGSGLWGYISSNKTWIGAPLTQNRTLLESNGWYEQYCANTMGFHWALNTELSPNKEVPLSQLLYDNEGHLTAFVAMIGYPLNRTTGETMHIRDNWDNQWEVLNSMNSLGNLDPPFIFNVDNLPPKVDPDMPATTLHVFFQSSSPTFVCAESTSTKQSKKSSSGYSIRQFRTAEVFAIICGSMLLGTWICIVLGHFTKEENAYSHYTRLTERD